MKINQCKSCRSRERERERESYTLVKYGAKEEVESTEM